MAGKNSAAPVIIKRKKVIAGGGHHGGAWKVAYADFVTAMMAFFLLMWLLGATTEKQRKGVADYFNPSITLASSGSGSDVLGGDTVTPKDIAPNSGEIPVNGHGPGREMTQDELKAMQSNVEEQLTAFGGESMTMQQALRHVVTKVTDEGLVIEIFDLEDMALFEGETSTPAPVLSEIARALTDVISGARNGIAINGHVRAYPATLRQNPVWALSSARAEAMRALLQDRGFPAARLKRVVGHADRKPVTADPMVVRNNRLEVVLLRRDR